MTADAQHEPDTAASEHGADGQTGIVEPVDTAAAPELAWSLEGDDTEPLRRSWRSAWGHVGIIAACSVLVAGVAAIGVALWANGFHNNVPKPAAPSSVSTTTTTTVKPVAAPPPAPPPATVTVTAPPPVTVTAAPPPTVTVQPSELPTTRAAPTHQPLVFTAAEDQAFLSDQQAHGLTIQDPAMVLHTAHDYCRMLVAGESIDQATEQLIAGGLQARVAPILTASAMIIYPGCY